MGIPCEGGTPHIRIQHADLFLRLAQDVLEKRCGKRLNPLNKIHRHQGATLLEPWIARSAPNRQMLRLDLDVLEPRILRPLLHRRRRVKRPPNLGTRFDEPVHYLDHCIARLERTILRVRHIRRLLELHPTPWLEVVEDLLHQPRPVLGAARHVPTMDVVLP
jgi:hypothetical protein